MNYLLLLAIVGICVGAYYQEASMERVQQQKIEADQKTTDAVNQCNALLEENKKLKLEKFALNEDLQDTEKKLAALTDKLQKAEDTTQAKVPPRAVKVAPKVLSNTLGTITTLDARTFKNCQLLKVEPDGITFNHADGITKVMFIVLPPDLQKRFGFDPQQGTELPATQVEFMENQRMAAAQADGN